MVPKIRFTTHAFGARGCAHPHPGWRARRARRVRAPPPRAGRRAPNAYPPYSLPATPSAARARGVASPPSALVCPSANAAPQPPTNLADVSFASFPPPDPPDISRHWQRCPSRPRPSILRYSLPTCQQPAHRVRAPAPPTRMHTAPQLPSPETAPPPHAGRSRLARPTPPQRTPAAPPPPATCPFLHAKPWT